MSETAPTRGVWVLTFASMFLFFLLMTRDILSLDCVCLEDAWEQFWPWFFYLAENVSQGRFPLWDPHSSCGFPFHANPQAGTFYPMYLLVGWLLGGGYPVFVGLWLGHWLFALVGCFFLAKRLGLSPLGSFAASVTFGFCGFFLGNAEHTAFVNVAAYVPWVILLQDLACERGLAYAFPAGVLLGMAGLSGYPGLFWYSLVMTVLWSPLRHGLCRRTAAVIGIVVALAGIVVSPTYISFFVEGAGYTHRVGTLDVKTACDSERFPLTAMVSLIVPRFTLIFREGMDSDPSMTNGYLGLLGLMSVLVTATCEPLRKRWKWLLVWMLIAWLFSLGSAGGIRVIGYYVLPVLRYMRHSALFRVYWLMGGAVLTGAVIDGLLNSSPEERARLVSLALRAMALIVCACLGACLFAAIVARQGDYPGALAAAFGQVTLAGGTMAVLFLYRRRLVTPAVCAALVTLILIVDCVTHFSENRVTVCAEGDGATAAASLQAVSRARSGAPLTGMEKRRDAPLIHPNQGLFDREFYVRSYNPAISPDYDFLVGGSVAGASSHPLRTPFLSILEQGPRFWLIPAVVYADVHDGRALKALQGKGFPQPAPIFVHSRVPVRPEPLQPPVSPGTYGTVRVVRYEPEQVLLHVDAPADAWLFCAERYAPGWQALVDGKTTVLYRANFCFRAVQIPKGVHDVALQYAPWLHKPFWALSWLTILFVLGAFAVIRMWEMKNTR